MEYIAFDAHKRYTLASVVRPDGQLVREQRIAHERGALQEFLGRCERGSPVAVETIGNWYWIVDEIKAAGCVPRQVHSREAKLMMGAINKTDRPMTTVYRVVAPCQARQRGGGRITSQPVSETDMVRCGARITRLIRRSRSATAW